MYSPWTTKIDARNEIDAILLVDGQECVALYLHLNELKRFAVLACPGIGFRRQWQSSCFVLGYARSETAQRSKDQVERKAFGHVILDH